MTKQEQAWLKLKQYIEQHPYTIMKIEFKEGAPYFAEEVKESIKFA